MQRGQAFIKWGQEAKRGQCTEPGVGKERQVRGRVRGGVAAKEQTLERD